MVYLSGADIIPIYLWMCNTMGIFLFALDEVIFFEYGVLRLSCLGFFLLIIDYKLTMWFIMRILGIETESDDVDNMTDEQRKEYYTKKYSKEVASAKSKKW